MEENNTLIPREELKTYFETGKYPTESQFGRFIDNYLHLNELNFGLDVKASADWTAKYYHFYQAGNIEKSGRGHINLEAESGSEPQPIENYVHAFSRIVSYKYLKVKLSNELDIDKYKPKIIIKRYKQKKKIKDGVKDSGFYREHLLDAKSWGRMSEYPVTSKEMILDINPINYFKPGSKFNEFYPSGTLTRPGSFRHTVHHRKPFSLIQMFLEIEINGTKYTSYPVNIKIVLGRDVNDLVNYIID
ncbi:hypothetical protein [Chryseobacterium sediminis]|uniref:Uncharacterized protein n=1 Tax=Chryseobacterium sediminis TaxID=1679494 RepID=A0A5B2UBY6_9FLAO|nr:hypothetical protein [Chryseobacterium sediminis]KAA2223857.1 hypothetical protein FW780_06585 [Chryseobacterium sediminis]MBB6330939.1 hypothetical protein [Chryseobacterium sediminis]